MRGVEGSHGVEVIALWERNGRKYRVRIQDLQFLGRPQGIQWIRPASGPEERTGIPSVNRYRRWDSSRDAGKGVGNTLGQWLATVRGNGKGLRVVTHPPSRFYGRTKLTEVPQFANPSRVPPHVPIVRVNAEPWQFGDWM